MKHILALLLSLLCLLPLAACGREPAEDPYLLSVEDAMEAEAHEICPLVTLTPESELVTWSQDGTRVLLLSWHRYPESYPPGETLRCEHGEVWTFTDGEICAWYEEHADTVTDWELRLKQLIGLPAEKEKTHFTAFWVDPEDVLRPAYQPDITSQMTEEDLDGSSLGDLAPWFEANEDSTYSGEPPYPWTRLGYTMDWADNGTDYGLTEFIILPDAPVEVEWTMTTEEFIQWMEAQ